MHQLLFPSFLPKKIEASAQAMDPTRNLINLAGVQLQQQGASRTNMSLRGPSNLTGTATLVLVDYRPITKSGGGYKSDGSGISNIDLGKIEVVRGPGSALWGPGVSSGVVHYITKNPIDYPGTTVELIGGELNTFGATVRHAGRNANKTFGYKINAHYKRGDEFNLDPIKDSTFLQTLQTSVVLPTITNDVPDPSIPGEVIIENLDEDGDGNPMQDYFENSSANVTFEFRPQDDFSIFASGGINRSSGLRYGNTSVELNQAQEFWGQARLQKGGFFAQVAIKDNDSGDYENFPTYSYQTGNIGGSTAQGLDAQTQYNFSIKSLNADFTVGLDYKQLKIDSRNLQFGRNEDDDDFRSFGGYAQGKFGLGNKFDLVVAGLESGLSSIRSKLVRNDDLVIGILRAAQMMWKWFLSFSKAITPVGGIRVTSSMSNVYSCCSVIWMSISVIRLMVSRYTNVSRSFLLSCFS